MALLETVYETMLFSMELGHAAGYQTGWYQGGCCGGYRKLVLPWGNLLAVDLVTLGGQLLVAGTDYWVANDTEGKPFYPGTVLFNGALFPWPCCGGHWYPIGYGCAGLSPDELAAQKLTLQYRCGYGATPEDVPANIRTWMLLRVGALYRNREEAAEVRNIPTMPFAESLLSTDRNFTFS
jgi:hypothetical protein